MKKQFLTALGALLLLLAAFPGASAAQSDPVLACRDSGGTVRLTLENVNAPVYALQLDLTLDGACPGAVFTPDVDAYVPDCRAEVSRGKTAVTIYISGLEDAPSGVLRLGELKPGGSYSLPNRAELILLDQNLRPIETGGTISVTTETGSGSGDKGSSSSGGKPGTSGTSGTSGTTAKTPLPFTDVAETDWCADAVRYVYENGLMNGTSASTFNPSGSTTRGMIVAILYRMEGSPAYAPPEGTPGYSADGTPAAAYNAAFTDVLPTAYYFSAVGWASANGIVNGYEDNTFRPNSLITREQMAAFLYRYARYKGCDVTMKGDLSAFADAPQIAAYAVEPLQWANAQGLVNGTSASTLSPKGTATRAQAAVILTRYVQNVVQPLG